MRDIAITLVVLMGCIYTLKKPYIGVLLWSWLSYMNPHRLSYGFAYSAPYALVTGLVLIGSMFFSNDKRKLPLNILVVTWILFVVFMGITTVFAYFPDLALTQYIRIVKIQLISIITIILITNLERLRQLIWTIVLSIGYYSIKGGIFTILTGGSKKVWGPEGSFIEDNNSLAIAVLMVIPLMIYLYQTVQKNFVKKSLMIAIVLSLINVLGSQSRGALLAIIAVGAFYWLKSEKKIISGFFIAIFALVAIGFMPESWFKRMDTIQTYEQDASAMGRINAWEYAFNAANHQLLGMGLDSWSLETFIKYAPNPLDVHAAHSIYFSVLADHGWIGLIMFSTIFFLGWRSLVNSLKLTENNHNYKEINNLVKMLQVGLIAYLVGGAFLSLSYFDLPWHYISFTVIIAQIINPSSRKVDKPLDSVFGQRRQQRL